VVRVAEQRNEAKIEVENRAKSEHPTDWANFSPTAEDRESRIEASQGSPKARTKEIHSQGSSSGHEEPFQGTDGSK